jgi:autoinducer 2 (AI-2) kinase
VHASPGFVGFDVDRPATAGRLECFRAIEESAAYVSRGHLGIIEEVSGLSIGDAVLTGGAGKGDLWPQLLADTLSIPIRVPVVKESTALGAALYAAQGAGLTNDAVEAGARLARYERTFDPDPAAAGVYDELYARWLELYDRSLAISEAGLVRPLCCGARRAPDPQRRRTRCLKPTPARKRTSTLTSRRPSRASS